MPGSVFLRGKNVTLRTVEEEDLGFLRDAINDPRVRRSLLMNRPVNGTQEQAYLDEQVASDDTVNLLVCRNQQAVGSIGLSNFDDRRDSAEIGLWIAPDHQGHGYGTEASYLLTGYAFDELGLHRVQARVLADNDASHRIWEKLGFEEEGVHREEAFTDGEYVDVHYYGVLTDEWGE